MIFFRKIYIFVRKENIYFSVCAFFDNFFDKKKLTDSKCISFYQNKSWSIMKIFHYCSPQKCCREVENIIEDCTVEWVFKCANITFLFVSKIPQIWQWHTQWWWMKVSDAWLISKYSTYFRNFGCIWFNFIFGTIVQKNEELKFYIRSLSFKRNIEKWALGSFSSSLLFFLEQN